MPNEINSGVQKKTRVQRRKEIRSMRNKFFGLSFVVILILAGIITAIIELAQPPSETQIPTSNAISQTTSEPASDAQNPNEQTLVQGVIGPIPSSPSYNVPTLDMIALSEFGRVDMAYFADAVFVGDSLTLGFQTYSSGIVNTNYAAYTGAGPRNIIEGFVTNVSGEQVVAIDEILASSPKKVYLQLGMNVLSSMDDETFLLYYENLVEFLSEQLPSDTVFYLQAITPVTAQKSADEPDYSNERIKNLNENLAILAYNNNWHFLDLFTALCDESGNLNEDIVAGSDGIHLNDLGYNMWREHLVTHTAYSSENPYIA